MSCLLKLVLFSRFQIFYLLLSTVPFQIFLTSNFSLKSIFRLKYFLLRLFLHHYCNQFFIIPFSSILRPLIFIFIHRWDSTEHFLSIFLYLHLFKVIPCVIFLYQIYFHARPRFGHSNYSLNFFAELPP